MGFSWSRQGTAATVDPAAAVLSPASARPGLTEEQRAKLGSLLVEFYGYLKTNAPAHPGLAAAVQEMHSAVAAYQSGQAEDPYGPIKRVLHAIESARLTDPSIPRP